MLAEPFEFYRATIFDTSIYTLFLVDEPIHYILRHNPSSGETLEDVLIAPYRLVAPYDTFTGHLYIGTPFMTELYIQFEDGENVSFIGIDRRPRVDGNIPQGYIPENLYNREELTYNRTVLRTRTGHTTTRQTSSGQEFSNIPNETIILIAGIIVLGVLFFYVKKAMTAVATKKEHAKARDDWNKKYAEIQENARRARQESTHYDSGKRSANPNLLNGNEYALFNEGKIDVLCPACDGRIFKSRNFLTNMNNYVCMNPSCDFSTMDFTNIQPLKYRSVSKEKTIEEILENNKDF